MLEQQWWGRRFRLPVGTVCDFFSASDAWVASARGGANGDRREGSRRRYRVPGRTTAVRFLKREQIYINLQLFVRFARQLMRLREALV